MARNLGHVLKSMIEIPVLRVGFSNNSANRLLCSSTQGLPTKQDSPVEQHDARASDEKEKVGNKNEEKIEAEADDEGEGGVYINKKTGEIGGPKGPEPTRYGDWEKGGRCCDF